MTLIRLPTRPHVPPAILNLDYRCELFDFCAAKAARSTVSELEQFVRDVRRAATQEQPQ